MSSITRGARGRGRGERASTTSIVAFLDEGLGHSSYLLDLGDGTAALVDPPRFPTEHEALADSRGLRITWVIDTHSHADYVTGSPDIVRRHGATFIAPAASRLETPHRGVHDGERVELSSSVALLAIATPGHTPDHHAYLLQENGHPVGLFTGGSLMVGTVGRTDLCGPELAVPLAHEMYRSLQRFDDFPDGLALYPTHGAGSFCSAPGAAERTTTLGRERTTNPMLDPQDEDAFVARLVDSFGTFPTYFSRLPELNRRGPATYDALPALARLSVDQFAAEMAAGTVVVDARPFGDFGDAHIPGSVSDALRPVFGSWLGWLTDLDQPLLFVLDADDDSAEVVRQCLDVGHEHLVGRLDGGIDAWIASGRPVRSIPVVDVDHFGDALVDVRQANEFDAGHVPNALNRELAAVATPPIPPGPLTVMCGHGERAMTAASILEGAGRGDISVFAGGPTEWVDATGRPLATRE